MSGHGCPVLNELEIREDYDPEHEQVPVLSGGDYDISAIRDCGENCPLARENARLTQALQGMDREITRLRAWLARIDGGDVPSQDASRLVRWAYEALTSGAPCPKDIG